MATFSIYLNRRCVFVVIYPEYSLSYNVACLFVSMNTRLALAHLVSSWLLMHGIYIFFRIEKSRIRIPLEADLTEFRCTEPIIITLPSCRYDLNNVERDVKHQIIFSFKKIFCVVFVLSDSDRIKKLEIYKTGIRETLL